MSPFTALRRLTEAKRVAMTSPVMCENEGPAPSTTMKCKVEQRAAVLPARLLIRGAPSG